MLYVFIYFEIQENGVIWIATDLSQLHIATLINVTVGANFVPLSPFLNGQASFIL